MKAFEASTIGGKARKIKTRQVGTYTVLEWQITKSRKSKDGTTQFLTFFCGLFNPREWIVERLTEGATVVCTGQTWERESDTKTWRTFEVSNILSIEAPAQAETGEEGGHDLPF